MQSWTGLISTARTTASQFKLADVANMFSRLLPGGDERSICWVIHPYVLAQLISMTGGDNVIFLGNDLNGKPKMKILNYDVLVSEKVPALGSANDVTLCDFRHYLIGEIKLNHESPRRSGLQASPEFRGGLLSTRPPRGIRNR